MYSLSLPHWKGKPAAGTKQDFQTGQLKESGSWDTNSEEEQGLVTNAAQSVLLLLL